MSSPQRGRLAPTRRQLQMEIDNLQKQNDELVSFHAGWCERGDDLLHYTNKHPPVVREVTRLREEIFRLSQQVKLHQEESARLLRLLKEAKK